jgi:hypothetical protein
MQQGVYRRSVVRGELSATVCPEATGRSPSQRRKTDQRTFLVSGHLQLQN